jgi:hypothetical protein
VDASGQLRSAFGAGVFWAAAWSVVLLVELLESVDDELGGADVSFELVPLMLLLELLLFVAVPFVSELLITPSLDRAFVCVLGVWVW